MSDTITLPPGTGAATDLITGLTYALGSSLSVAAGQAIILNLGSPEATNLAGVSTAAAKGAAPTVQTPASIVAGYAALNMVNNQTEFFTAEVLNGAGAALNYVPAVIWSLQSGSVGVITPDGTYTAPASGIGTATVIASYGGVSTSFAVKIVPFTGPGHDVGIVGTSGGDSYSSWTYILTGAGAGFAATADAFHSMSQPITGDVSIISQVTSQSGTNTNAGAGVMIRNSSGVTGTNANSSFASIMYTPANTLVFEYRAADGATLASTSIASASTTPYLEITRSGSSFSAFYSTNGATWTQLGTTQTLALASLARVGLAVTSGSTSQTSTAAFSNSQITRVAAEVPTLSVSPTAALYNGTTTQIVTASTVVDGSAGTALTYQWWSVGWPGNGPVTVNGQGSTSATVYFTVYEAGTYTFAVKATDAYGLYVIGTASVTVGQTITSLTATDPKQYVAANSTQQIIAQALDQFGNPMTTPTTTWSVTGGGSISSTGLFTAPSSSGISEVTATAGGKMATVVVGSTPLTVAGVDVGTVAIAGGENYITGTYTVTGSGGGITGANDAFHFVSTPITGSFSLSADLLSQSSTIATAGAGVMIRNGTASNAIFAGVIDSPTGCNGLLFDWRSTANGPLSWVAAPSPLGPTWLRLTDSSGTVAAYYSINGTTWIQLGTSQSLGLGTSPQVGLVVSSAGSNTSTAVFNSLSIVPSAGPTVATATTATVTGATLALSATGSDPAGEATLKYAWSAVGNLTAGVTFTASGTNAAKNATAIFTAPGIYDLRVVATDTLGLSAIADITVAVVQTLTGIVITPASVAVMTGGANQYSAVANDQFSVAMPFQPALFWSATAGSINANSGFYTAPASAQTVTISATTGSVTGNLSVAIKSLGVFSLAQDVGTPTLVGSSNYSAGAYTIIGSGSDIWSASDQFQFAYEQLTGDGVIIARVTGQLNTQSAGHSKAGIMFRNTLNANSAFADIVMTYSDGIEFDYRNSAGAGPSQAGTVAGVLSTSDYWLRLTRNGNVFTFATAPDVTGSPGTWTTFATTATVAMNETIYVGLAVTSTNTSKLNTATFDNVFVTGQTRTFTNNQDIGGPAVAGSYTQNGSTATLTGSGADITGAADQFQFAYLPITGDTTITARIASFPSSGSTANEKAGVMIRNTLTAGSIEADVLVNPGKQSRFDRRTTTSGSIASTTHTDSAVIYWVRLARSGNSFTASVSPDGSTWTTIGTSTITMNSTVYVGLALTSVSASTLATATFDNITITGSADATPTVSTAAVASGATPTSVNLSVLGADSDGGGESNLTYTWAAIGAPASGVGSVGFSTNGTNAAKTTTATFTAAGSYAFQVTITDQGGLSVVSYVTAAFTQSFTSISLTPASPNLSPLGTTTLNAVALDQFGNAMVAQPTFTWSVISGGGSVAGGVYTAPLTGTSATVQASSGGIVGSAAVTITNQPPLAASSVGAAAVLTGSNAANLSVVGVDDSGQANLTYTWAAISPPLPVTFSINGTNAAQNTVATFSAIGTYLLQATITDPSGLTATSTTNVTINTILGTGGNDTIRLVRSGANLVVYNDAANYSIPYASLGAITINGGSGVDSVNIDFSGGPTPVPTAGLTIDGTGGIDTLAVTGTTAADVATVSANQVVFDGSAINYLNVTAISVNGNGGADSLTQMAQPGNGATLGFAAGAGNSLNVSSGSYVFAAPTAGTNITELPFSTINVGVGATVTVDSSINHADRYLLTLGSLSLAGSTGNWTGMLDIGWNDILIHNGVLSDIVNQIVTHHLMSSKIPISYSLNTLGAIQNNDGNNNPLYGSGTTLGLFDGSNSTTTDVLIKYTYWGDANLDGKVDAGDYTKIDNGFLQQLTGWANGDFNYDSTVNGSDYTLIDNAFNTQGASLAAQIAMPHVKASADIVGRSAKPKMVAAGRAVFVPSLPVNTSIIWPTIAEVTLVNSIFGSTDDDGLRDDLYLNI